MSPTTREPHRFDSTIAGAIAELALVPSPIHQPAVTRLMTPSYLYDHLDDLRPLARVSNARSTGREEIDRVSAWRHDRLGPVSTRTESATNGYQPRVSPLPLPLPLLFFFQPDEIPPSRRLYITNGRNHLDAKRPITRYASFSISPTSMAATSLLDRGIPARRVSARFNTQSMNV